MGCQALQVTRSNPWPRVKIPPKRTNRLCFHKKAVVVVLLYFELKFIKYKGGVSLTDVGLCKMSMPTLAKRTKPCGVSSLTGYKV